MSTKDKCIPWNKGLTSKTDSRITTNTVRHNLFRYTKNNDYFKIVNEQTAHWAGFIASDGCIRVNNKSKNVTPDIIEFSQKRSDKEYLIQLKRDLKYTGPVHDKIIKWKHGKWSGTSDVSTLCISGASVLCKDLNDMYNIVERKSYILKPPNITNLSDKLAYIVGLIDGDGCIYKRNDYEYVHIVLVGSYYILEWVKNIFDDLVPSRSSIVCAKVHKANDGNYFRYSISGNRSTKIYNILKNVKCYHMDRKWCY